MACRLVLGHMDRAANLDAALDHIAAATRSTSDKTATELQTAKLNPSPGNAARSFAKRATIANEATNSGSKTGPITAHLIWREHASMATKVVTPASGTSNALITTIRRGISPMMAATATSNASTIQSATVNMKLAIASPIVASPPPAEKETVESIAT